MNTVDDLPPCCTTPIAASLAWPATRRCWRTISKPRKAVSRESPSPILAAFVNHLAPFVFRFFGNRSFVRLLFR